MEKTVPFYVNLLYNSVRKIYRAIFLTRKNAGMRRSSSQEFKDGKE